MSEYIDFVFEVFVALLVTGGVLVAAGMLLSLLRAVWEEFNE